MAFARRELRIPRPGISLEVPPEAWLAAGLIGAVACATLASGDDRSLFLALAVTSLATGAALYEPRLIGPMLAVALPLEITKLAFPLFETRAELGGGLPPTSVIDAGRIVVAIAFAVWLLRPGRPRTDALPATPLTLPLSLLFAAYALSSLYGLDAHAARIESMRLLFALGSFALLPFFVRDRASLRWTMLAFVAMAALLAAIGVYQQASGDFFWNDGLGMYGERRINTTFADPNHFARYLVEGIVAAIALWFFVGRRAKFAFLLPAMGICMLTLGFTGSRGAWLVALVALPAMVMLLPIARSLRLRMLGMGAALLVLAAGAFFALNPYFAKRVDTLALGFDAAGARPYLVEAGIEMFRDHPLTGVGAGAYQRAFEEDYIGFKDERIKADITLSHTSFVTIAAELGVIGLVVLAFLAWRWLAYVRAVLRVSDAPVHATVLALAMVTLIIALGSQTEGRFFEDPYLWFAAGLVVAAEGIVMRERAARSSRRRR